MTGGSLRLVVRFLLLVALVAGVVSMHTIGHTPGHGTSSVALDHHAAGNHADTDVMAAGQSVPVASGGSHHDGSSGSMAEDVLMCLAIVGAAVLTGLTLLGLLGPAATTLARMRRAVFSPAGPAVPPPRWALLLTTVAVIRI